MFHSLVNWNIWPTDFFYMLHMQVVWWRTNRRASDIWWNIGCPTRSRLPILHLSPPLFSCWDRGQHGRLAHRSEELPRRRRPRPAPPPAPLRRHLGATSSSAAGHRCLSSTRARGGGSALALRMGAVCPSGAARGGGLGSSRASDAEVDSDDGGFGSAGKSEQER